jgi:glucose/arabinose dehydrogenase
MRPVVGVLVSVLALMLAAEAGAGVRLKRLTSGYTMPVQATAPRTESHRMYIVEQPGRIIRRVRGGDRNVFLDIRDRVELNGERGLLALAFHWDYANTRWLYVLYVNNAGDVVVARYTANSARTRAVESSRVRLLAVEHSSHTNHNGGALAFGPDRRLYVSLGDGGGGCDPDENAQDLSTMLGKLASRDVDPPMGAWRIEGYGLRNPWRFSFDRVTGAPWIGDVGQGSQEEINRRRPALAGGTPENYGWDAFEGFAASGCASDGLQGPSPHSPPLDAYSHSLGCSITGGHVYRGSAIDGLYGWYIFGDYCSGRIWKLRRTSTGGVRRVLMFDTGLNITSFGEKRSGELFVVHHGGAIYGIQRS